MTVSLLALVSATLAMWAFLRRRRILAAGVAFPAAGGDGGLAVARDPAPAPRARTRPHLSDLGVHPLAGWLAACNVAVFAADIVLFSITGLSVDWSTVWLYATLLSVLLVVWLNFYVVPGPRDERLVAEAILVVFILILLTNVASPMQYGAIALRAPFVDGRLAAADARLGIHVPALAAWTRTHARIRLLARIAYESLLPQFVCTVLLLAVLRERERLWEFAFHFQLCLVATVAALTVWPAACAPVFFGFEPALDARHAIAQIQGLHAGTLTIVRFNELDGLVSVPSFHAAGGMIVTWAFRSRPRILVPVIVLNAALLVATSITGVHYVVDVLAAVPLVGVSLAAYRWWGRTLLPERERGVERAAAD